MKMKLIPKTNLKVSPVCLGTMTFGTPVAEADAIKLVHYAFDQGINFVDTANMYEGYTRVPGSAGGVAEEILGKAVAGRRDNFVIATKVGMKVGAAPEDEGTSPNAIRRQLQKSLARLRTGYVDVYYLHRHDPAVDYAEVIGALVEAIQKGMIRHYGISNFSAEQTRKILEIADQHRLPRPVAHQPPYSLLKRDIERDLLPLCEREGLGVVPYQILQGGLLCGKYRRNEQPPPGSRKSEQASWLPEFTPELHDQLEKIEQEARAKGRSMMQHAMLEVLSQPAVTSVVMGVKSISQLETLIKCL